MIEEALMTPVIFSVLLKMTKFSRERKSFVQVLVESVSTQPGEHFAPIRK